MTMELEGVSKVVMVDMAKMYGIIHRYQHQDFSKILKPAWESSVEHEPTALTSGHPGIKQVLDEKSDHAESGEENPFDRIMKF